MAELGLRHVFRKHEVVKHPQVRTLSLPQSIVNVMCYMCFRYNPFAASDDSSTTEYKRKRAIDVKALLKEADDVAACDTGERAIELLRQEQYRLSREL